MFQTNTIASAGSRTYHIYIPPNPPQALLPAIIVFHGGGQDPRTIAARWGVAPGNPVPALVENYLLVFPEADPHLSDEWVHYKMGDSAFPDYDLLFVDALVNELTTTAYPTGNMAIPNVSADPGLLYAAGFSNGGGMVWQIANSDRVGLFQGFAAVGKALDPEKAEKYRQQLGGAAPPPVPFMYIHGTADKTFATPIFDVASADTTRPALSVREMLDRNGIAAGAPAATQLIAGSTNTTEVVMQLFVGAAAFSYVTVINGGHNWPTPTTVGNPPVATHFNATQAVVEFWQNNAGLP